MDTGTSSAVGWINLTTLLLRRFASFGRAAPSRLVTRRGRCLTDPIRKWFHPLASIPVRAATLRGIRPGMDDPDGTHKGRGEHRDATVPRTWLVSNPANRRRSHAPHFPPRLATGKESPCPYTERLDAGCVNTVNRSRFLELPATSRRRNSLRQRRPHRHPWNFDAVLFLPPTSVGWGNNGARGVMVHDTASRHAARFEERCEDRWD